MIDVWKFVSGNTEPMSVVRHGVAQCTMHNSWTDSLYAGCDGIFWHTERKRWKIEKKKQANIDVLSAEHT